jgi:hypothetical protein
MQKLFQKRFAKKETRNKTLLGRVARREETRNKTLLGRVARREENAYTVINL